MTAAGVIATPLLAALLLAALPSWRLSRWINVAAGALTFLQACRLPGQPAAQGVLLADPLAVHMVLLTSFIGLSAAWFSAFYVVQEAATGRLDAPRLRLYHAMFQAFLGFMLLALLSDNTGVTWVAVEAATIAAVVVVSLPRTAEAIEASWKFFLLCGVAIALALFGTIVLYLAAAPVLGDGFPAMRWSALATAGARCDGALLNLAFVFLLIGYGTKAGLAPLHGWMADAHAEGPTPVSAMLSGSILNVALFVILRLRGVMQGNADAGLGAIAPGPPIMALGLLSVLMAAFALWRRRDIKRFFAFSTIEQSGLAAFAFGLGGPAAIFAGLLHLTVHTLAKAALFQCVGHAAQLKGGQRFAGIRGLLATHPALGLSLGAAILVVAGLPPGGLFASEFLIASRTMIQAPLLAVPLALGLVVGAWGLIERLQELCLGAPTPDGGVAPTAAALWPVWVHLAVVVVLGVAMPLEVAGWLRGGGGLGGVRRSVAVARGGARRVRGHDGRKRRPKASVLVSWRSTRSAAIWTGCLKRRPGDDRPIPLPQAIATRALPHRAAPGAGRDGARPPAPSCRQQRPDHHGASSEPYFPRTMCPERTGPARESDGLPARSLHPILQPATGGTPRL